MISRGEGFSPTVYEAMALEVPCIVSNNSAHTSLCDAELVKGILCPLKRDGFLFYLFEYAGNEFDCHQEDVQKVMREVYEKYHEAQVRTQKAMEHAERYEWEHVIKQYKTIFSPERVVIGSYNAVEGTTLVTTSERLALKYMIQKICSMDIKKMSNATLLYLFERDSEVLNFYVVLLRDLLIK